MSEKIKKVLMWPFRKLYDKIKNDYEITPPAVRNNLWIGYWFALVGMGVIDSIVSPPAGSFFMLGIFVTMLVVSISGRAVYEEERMWADLKEKFK